MKFKREQFSDYYLRDTHIENVFINEYMPNASGDFVKVYLFALMYAGHDSKMNNEIIAKQLNMDVLDVMKAWDFWEKQGVVKKHIKDAKDKFDYCVEFINLKELVYCNNKKEKKQGESGIPENHKNLLENDEIKNMYEDIEQATGRLVESNEAREIISIISESDISPALVAMAYNYCAKKRSNSKAKYVLSVIKEWVNQGFKSADQVDEYLEETDNRHFMYKKILKSLGLFRHPTDEERRIIDTWFDELGFDIEMIIQACNKTSGISNPNINYINSVLKGWKSGEKGKASGASTRKPSEIGSIMKQYDETRERNRLETERRRTEIYAKLPEIKTIEDEARSESLKFSKLMLSGSSGKGDLKKAQEKMNKLSEEKAFLLTEANFSMDYLETIYDCKECQDTGMLENGDRCKCFALKLTKNMKEDLK